MDIYKHKKFVMRYLSIKYDENTAEELWDSKSISETDMTFISNNVLPKELVCDDTLDANDISEYKKRYNQSILTTYDKKMISSSIALKKSYEKHKISSSKTILLPYNEMKQEVTCECKQNTSKKMKKTLNEIKYCKAYKMNGEKCNAKVTDGTEVCKRHKIKSKK